MRIRFYASWIPCRWSYPITTCNYTFYECSELHNYCRVFNVHGSVHCKNILIYIYIYIYPTRCNVTQFILSRNCSTCFECYHHPSSGGHATVPTASICHTVTATCRYRGRDGTGLSVLCTAHSNQFQLFHDNGR